MYGAILGDMIGSPYEFDRGNKTKDFPLCRHGDENILMLVMEDGSWGFLYQHGRTEN